MELDWISTELGGTWTIRSYSVASLTVVLLVSWTDWLPVKKHANSHRHYSPRWCGWRDRRSFHSTNDVTPGCDVLRLNWYKGVIWKNICVYHASPVWFIPTKFGLSIITVMIAIMYWMYQGLGRRCTVPVQYRSMSWKKSCHGMHVQRVSWRKEERPLSWNL